LKDEGIQFFAEKGEINITSKLSKFSTSAVVTGSVNQQYMDEFIKIRQQFNGQELDFVKERFDAQRANDTAKLSQIDRNEKNLMRRKVLYTTNFAVNHGQYEVAPYIALTELYYANFQLLDTIHKSLSPTVIKSKYGQEFERLMQTIAKEENK